MFQATIKNTALPSLVVKNLPNDVSADTLRESFGKFEPLAVRMSGKRCITVSYYHMCWNSISYPTYVYDR
jgi:RNA recognition motif-containing protein